MDRYPTAEEVEEVRRRYRVSPLTLIPIGAGLAVLVWYLTGYPGKSIARVVLAVVACSLLLPNYRAQAKRSAFGPHEQRVADQLMISGYDLWAAGLSNNPEARRAFHRGRYQQIAHFLRLSMAFTLAFLP